MKGSYATQTLGQAKLTTFNTLKKKTIKSAVCCMFSDDQGKITDDVKYIFWTGNYAV